MLQHMVHTLTASFLNGKMLCVEGNQMLPECFIYETHHLPGLKNAFTCIYICNIICLSVC